MLPFGVLFLFKILNSNIQFQLQDLVLPLGKREFLNDHK